MVSLEQFKFKLFKRYYHFMEIFAISKDYYLILTEAIIIIKWLIKVFQMAINFIIIINFTIAISYLKSIVISIIIY